MEKYLVLGFKNAGLFRKHKKTRDKIFDMFGTKDRFGEDEFIEPITSQQISNMIHVLFGERPKPFNRETSYSSIDYLVDKAKNSYLRIDSYKNDKGKFYGENIQLKKAVWNSWNPVSYMNWNRVYNLLDKDKDGLYTLVKNTIFDVFKLDITNVSFNEVKNMILNTTDSRLDEMFKITNSKMKKPFYESIYGVGNAQASINANPRTAMTVLSGLDKIIRLSGEILIPINDEDIEIIKKNKGSATILDGGLVYIKSIKSSNIINVDDFTLVSEISLEKQ